MMTKPALLARRASLAMANGHRILLTSETATTLCTRRQTRGFHFGFWSSIFNPELRRELRRRQYMLKLKYSPTPNRHLSREKHDKHAACKGNQTHLSHLENAYWHRRQGCHRHRAAGGWGQWKTPDNPTGERPGRNIEDAERAPLEHLLFGDKPRPNPYEYDHSSSPFQNIRNYMAHQRDQILKSWDQDTEYSATAKSSSDLSKRKTGRAQTSDEDPDYVIDPISNRKVPKNTSPQPKSMLDTDGDQIPVKPFRGFVSGSTIFEDQPPETFRSKEHGNEDPKVVNGVKARDDTPSSGKTSADSSQPQTSERGQYRGHVFNRASNISTIMGDNFITWRYKGLFWQKEELPDEEQPGTSPKLRTEGTESTSSNAIHKASDATSPLRKMDSPEVVTTESGEVSKGKPMEDVEAQSLDQRPAPSFTVLHEEPKPEELRDYNADSSVEDTLENLRAKDVRAAVGRSLPTRAESKTSRDRVVKDAITPSDLPASNAGFAEQTPVAASTETASNTFSYTESPETRSWTGNYARDFPEDFAKSWSTEISGFTTTTSPDFGESLPLTAPLESPQAQRAKTRDSPSEAQTRLQPALDRHTPQEHPTANLSKHQRISEDNEERIQEEDELIQEIRKIYEDSLAPATASDRNAEPVSTDVKKAHTSASGDTTTDPTVYKILAYDPTMQTINTAETTSIVNDSASPLTPAEVLLRLSNPAKFFPHFGPLQAQGYEIVSGSGDVLIFRKVRDAVAPTPEVRSSAIASAPGTEFVPSATSAPVNPIDLTGHRPLPPTNNAAANFASPTGYVNYDLPPLEQPVAPFRSGIDVRREEPVFSGPKIGTKTNQRNRRVWTRILVGAAWVAGLSYALGVVGEYFKTGGMDGMGPKGF